MNKLKRKFQMKKQMMKKMKINKKVKEIKIRLKSKKFLQKKMKKEFLDWFKSKNKNNPNNKRQKIIIYKNHLFL
jgi:hypothetical protein